MTPEVKERIEQIRHGNVPEGYVMSEVAICPKEWNFASIADVGSVITGSTPPTTNANYYLGNKLFITPADFNAGLYIGKSKRTISDSAYSVSRIVPANSIYVVCIGATVGKINMCVDEAVCNQQINAVIPKKENDSVFLYYCIDYFFNKIKKKYIGEQTLPIVSKGQFSKIQIVLPQVEEQQKIAGILAKQDRIIELKGKLLSEKQRQKKYLMQRLLTGKKRLHGFDGEWMYVRANQIFKNVTDKKHDGTMEVLSATQDRGIIPRSHVDIDIKYAEESLTGYKKVVKGDFVLSLRSFQGGIEYSEYTGIVSPAYTVLTSICPIEDNYYRQFFKSADYINRLNIAVYGIRDGKQISYDDFGRIKIPYPPLDEQKAIATVLATADKEIEILKQTIEQEKQKKKALMQLLLTGIVRVSV